MVPITLELNHLRAFSVAARHLHFRKAAEELGTTQPALSRRIKELEEILGFALFERSTRSVSLLPQGKLLHDHLPRLFTELDVAYERARNAALGRAGLLRIGVIGTPVMSFIHQPLLEFRKEYPDYEVSLEEESSAVIARRIAEGLIECGFFLSSVSHPKIAQRIVARDKLAFAIPGGNPLAKEEAIRFKDLREQTLILFPSERNPQLYQQIVKAIPGFSTQNSLEASSRQTAIMMAAAGFGIAVIGESMRQMCPDTVNCIPLSGPAVGVDIVMGWTKGRSNVLAPFFRSRVRSR